LNDEWGVQYAFFSRNEDPPTSLFIGNCTPYSLELLGAERLMRALRLFGIVAIWVLSACLNAWAIAALYFDFSRAGREWLPATIYVAVLTVVLLTIPKRIFRIGACFTGFLIVLVCWWRMPQQLSSIERIFLRRVRSGVHGGEAQGKHICCAEGAFKSSPNNERPHQSGLGCKSYSLNGPFWTTNEILNFL
jgi:hypothetical protein